ncbi:SDR family NAD(P)-dependent oxidoreductase [Actinomadura violacea]|uniref:SDR family NAD(P)-dependent oxidoreductase n=1 Tax=Actinomadura violacea TaxID=2819934 RepID=A0ABS3S0V5_9ACTN|nr:SDR family NAD(P)-dependent oxidoreductase [Actinomadura violacea]MBO2462644.1 SDR family NAD(P)-dependent oxidoreductase [Actinomadura violacea]
MTTNNAAGSAIEDAADRERTAIVTGASNGIGRAIAATLASEGVRVHICARDAETIDKTVAELRAEGLEVRGGACDVTDPDQVSAFVAACVERDGPVDVLVNNAGRPGGGITAQIDKELWYSTIDTNLNAVFLMTKAVLNEGRMRERPSGRLINIASVWGKQGVPAGAPYAAAKHGVVGFTRSLALELATSGITVNAVCPGYVETPMSVNVRDCQAGIWKVSKEEALARVASEIPIGRYSQPAEVAWMVSYLASARSASVTGQALNVCGGFGVY